MTRCRPGSQERHIICRHHKTEGNSGGCQVEFRPHSKQSTVENYNLQNYRHLSCQCSNKLLTFVCQAKPKILAWRSLGRLINVTRHCYCHDCHISIIELNKAWHVTPFGHGVVSYKELTCRGRSVDLKSTRWSARPCFLFPPLTTGLRIPDYFSLTHPPVSCLGDICAHWQEGKPEGRTGNFPHCCRHHVCSQQQPRPRGRPGRPPSAGVPVLPFGHGPRSTLDRQPRAQPGLFLTRCGSVGTSRLPGRLGEPESR